MTTLVGSRTSASITDLLPGVRVFEPASTIKNRALRWAIPGLIALGDVTIFAGPRKCGKSMMVAHLAACFTRGTPFAPGLLVEAQAQGEVLIYNGERAIDCFAKPRCEAAGADLERLYIVGDAYTLDDVIADIEKRPLTIRLVIIDPLKACVDAARISDAKARQLLRKLEKLARDRDLAIVIMHHVTLRGRKSDDPTDFIQGKRVWIEAALCACMLCPLNDGYILQNVASNKLAGQCYEYQIEPHTLADGTETERIVMLGESKHDIVHALNGQAGRMLVKSKLQRASEWLMEYLKDGPRLRNDVYADGIREGHSQPTLMRAKQECGIEDSKRLGDGLSEWYLPLIPDSRDQVDSVATQPTADAT
jgi:AAA domain